MKPSRKRRAGLGRNNIKFNYSSTGGTKETQGDIPVSPLSWILLASDPDYGCDYKLIIVN